MPKPWSARVLAEIPDPRSRGMVQAVQLLSLVAEESGLTGAQAEVAHGGADKPNKHKTALRLLEGLILEARLITGDAIFCQRGLSR